MINCQEAVKKLYEYLDRQLTEEEAVEVIEHLERCPPCNDHFRFEEGILTRVSQACRQVEVPATLLERVRKICSEAPDQNR